MEPPLWSTQSAQHEQVRKWTFIILHHWNLADVCYYSITYHILTDQAQPLPTQLLRGAHLEGGGNWGWWLGLGQGIGMLFLSTVCDWGWKRSSYSIDISYLWLHNKVSPNFVGHGHRPPQHIVSTQSWTCHLAQLLGLSSLSLLNVYSTAHGDYTKCQV